MGILHEDRYTFFITSHSVLLRMRNTSISDKNCRENQHIHIFCSMPFFENRAVYEIMWKNTVEPDRTHGNMAHAHCILYN
jgi:hypothetical protein